MASLGEELLISADSHVIEDPHFWENRLPASFKDQAPVFPERQVGGTYQAHPGGWDPHERVTEMAAWRAMRGITHLCVNTMGLGLAGADAHVRALEGFKQDVLG